MRLRSGVTIIELVVVVVVIGLMAVVAVPMFGGFFTDQRVKGAARSVADSLLLARAEAIRTGNTHLVIFQQALDATEPIVVVNDGAPDVADCTIAAGEVRHSVSAVEDVLWGTTTTLANGTAAPDDPGAAPAAVAAGSSFTDATRSPANPATWVLFQPDGVPRLFTPDTGGGSCDEIGLVGQGGGGIYLTNTRRDYAVVLSHLGTTRVHLWNPSSGGWRD